MYLCISLHTTVVPNTAQQSSDNLPPFPPDSYHYLDVVYWRKGHGYPKNLGTNTVSVHPKMLFDIDVPKTLHQTISVSMNVRS